MISPVEIVVLLALLFVKHFVVDFPLQTPYQWQNKGTYGHVGGIIHSALHAIGTGLIVVFFIPDPTPLGKFLCATTLALLDGVIHYHVDWAKMSLNKKLGYTPSTNGFWNLLGADQLIHSLTYLVIVVIIFS